MSLRPVPLARSDVCMAWQADGCGFDPHARHILSWRFGHEKKKYDHSLPLLIQEGPQWSVTGERMRTIKSTGKLPRRLA